MLKNNFMIAGWLLVTITLLLIGSDALAGEGKSIDIIPKPDNLQRQKGYFTLTPNTEIIIKDDSYEVARLGGYLRDLIEELTALRLRLRINPAEKSPIGSIVLAIDKEAFSLGDEGYRQEISQSMIQITASKPAGLFYGIQTLRQLLMDTGEGDRRIPCLKIVDKPQYQWRGFLLDCCRHFMTADFVKRTIDLLAFHKMNVLHWHLTEDQGWRIEIKQYPRLTEIGAWREENGHKYGGYYTQEQIKDIVDYAASRYVMVVPEIEMPGHSTAALAAYPQYSCEQRPVSVETHWGIFKDVYCPGKESTFTFLQNILKEVCELFPAPYIHIGGDEVPKDHWENCPDCQRRIKEEGLKDEEELQGYFTKRIEDYVRSLGKSIIGWDEILEGGVSQTAIVQSWRGMEGAIIGAQHGNYVIVSPGNYTYFYNPQVPGEAKYTWKTINSLERVYSFDPAPAQLTPEQRKYVLGGEGCMWTEYTYQFEVDRQVFPRLCALSEVLWSANDAKDFSDFSRRLDRHYQRLAALGVEYNRPEICVGKWDSTEVTNRVSQLWWDVTD